MKQERIKELLEEAAKPKCTAKRREGIQKQLKRATLYYGNPQDSYVSSSLEYADLSLNLFKKTAKEEPQRLPGLFPLFAFICGDREANECVTRDIDWFLMDPLSYKRDPDDDDNLGRLNR